MHVGFGERARGGARVAEADLETAYKASDVRALPDPFNFRDPDLRGPSAGCAYACRKDTCVQDALRVSAESLLCYKPLKGLEIAPSSGIVKGEMGVVKAKIQTVEDIYRLVWTAVANRQPIGAIQGPLPAVLPAQIGS